MKLKFLTSNMHKYNEISAFLGQLGIECQWVKMKYEEIQGESTEEISRDSAVKLSRQMGDKFFLEDTGLYINSLKGFPGPYSSYISKTIGNEGILDLLKIKKDQPIS
jgi:dITPase (EC 3.6.1.-)